jgi:hypothetical protein
MEFRHALGFVVCVRWSEEWRKWWVDSGHNGNTIDTALGPGSELQELSARRAKVAS